MSDVLRQFVRDVEKATTARRVLAIGKAMAKHFDKEREVLINALRPFVEITLERDNNPAARDMISGPDLAITPKHVRAARAAIHSGKDAAA